MPQLRRTPPLPPRAERRKADRVELFAQVELRTHDEVRILSVTNISAGGVLLQNDGIEIDPGDTVSVSVDANDISFTLDATVIRCNATDLAVQWTSNDCEALTRLLDSLR